MPNELNITSKDCVHVQWEGSNTQPQNQAGEGRDQTDRSNMVAVGAPNWNIPKGELEEEDELGTFQFGSETFEYRIFENKNFNFLEAKQQCERYNMALPELKSSRQNAQIRDVNKSRHGRWYGDIFVGEEGRFVLMDRKGRGRSFDEDRRIDTALCVREARQARERPQARDLFLNADWLWSSMGQTSANKDLVVQMASSGYYQCIKEDECEKASDRSRRSRDRLQDQLNNAPASFLGNIVKFKPGEYFYMSTRNNNFSNRAQKGSIYVV